MNEKTKINKTLHGIGVSPGVVIAPAFMVTSESVCVVRHKISKEGIFTGVGASTDIVEASAFAYMDIVNKITRMKKFGKKTGK